MRRGSSVKRGQNAPCGKTLHSLLAHALDQATARRLGRPRAKADPARYKPVAARYRRRRLELHWRDRTEASASRAAATQDKRVSTRKAQAAARKAGLVWRPDYLGGPCTREQADADVAARKSRADAARKGGG